jgi:hypothetical protein
LRNQLFFAPPETSESQLLRTGVAVEKGTNTVISCDSPRFRERTINHLRTNFGVISAQK